VGVWVSACDTVTLTNCTIVGNEDEGVRRDGGLVTVRNTILFYNSSGGPQHSGEIAFEYCDVQGGIVPGPGNISQGPGFSASACDECQLRLPGVFSPCVDAGDPAPEYRDQCFTFGTERNDIGRFGGPANCWANPCYADCNSDCVRNLSDFGCFQTKFATGAPYADCNGDGVLNLSDFGCFQTRFAIGCP
jgi:hypothetical protein